jgi:competence protein ComEC
LVHGKDESITLSTFMQLMTKILLGGMSMVVLVIWWQVVQRPGGDVLRVVFCDVGQGDAFLLTKGYQQVLVDGGPANQRVLECLAAYMPAGDETIELVVATHPDADHIGGLVAVLDRYEVLAFGWVPMRKQTAVFTELDERVRWLRTNAELRVYDLYASDRLHIDSSWQMLVVWPTQRYANVNYCIDEIVECSDSREVNEASLVIHMQYEQFDVLLNGDAGESVQALQLYNGSVPKQVEVMSVPHHGSSDGLSHEWLRHVAADLGVISVGKGNSYGHPAAVTLQMLEGQQIDVRRTDVEGTVVLESDGESWWVR